MRAFLELCLRYRLLVLAGGSRVLAGDFGTGIASIHELHLAGTAVTAASCRSLRPDAIAS